MKLKYKFFDKEDWKGRTILYEYDVPFIENMDNDLKSMYGENLTFVKELNHRDRIIRIHSAYDSGKGALYISPYPRKKPRKKLKLRLKEILESKKTNVLKIENEYENEHLFIIFSPKYLSIFKEGTYVNGIVSGYKTVISNTDFSLFNFLKGQNYYPYTYSYLE